MSPTKTKDLTELDWIRQQAAAFRKNAEESTLSGVLSKHFQVEPDKPYFLEDKQAQAFGFDIPDTWKIKAYQDPDAGTISFRQITPSGWEIEGEDTVISPTGQSFTFEDIETFSDAEKLATGLYTQGKQILSELPETTQLPEQIIEQPPMAPPGLVYDSETDSYVAATLDLDVTRNFYTEHPELLPEGVSPALTFDEFNTLVADQEAKQIETVNTFKMVMPSVLEGIPDEAQIDVVSEIWNQLSSGEPQYEATKDWFVKSLQDAGRTIESENLLKMLGMDVYQIAEFYRGPAEGDEFVSGEQIIADQAATLPTLTWINRVQELKDNPTTLLPFIGSGVELFTLGKLMKTALDLENGKDISTEDMAALYAYVEKGQRETDWGYKVADVVAQLPAFALELLLTGGIFTAGKTATVKASTIALNKLATKTGLKLLEGRLAKLGIQAAGVVAGGSLQTIPSGITKIPAATLEKQLVAELTGDEEDVWTSVIKSVGEQWVEVVSERTGGMLTSLTGAAKGKLVKMGLLNAFQKANPGKSVGELQKLMNGLGYNGIFGEMFEERIGEVAHGILAKLGLGNQEYQLPSWEQLSIELVSFAIPGAAFSAAQRLQGVDLSGEGGFVRLGGEEAEIPPRPLVNPKASALAQDKQLRAQQAWDKQYGKATTTPTEQGVTPIEPVALEVASRIKELETEKAKLIQTVQKAKQKFESTQAEKRIAEINNEIDAITIRPVTSEVAPTEVVTPEDTTRLAEIRKQRNILTALNLEQGGLTEAQAKEFEVLAREESAIRYKQVIPIDISKVQSVEKRKSTMSPEIVVVAQHDFVKNRAVYDAIDEASSGVWLNRDTPVDDIVNGKSNKVTARELYDVFEPTREALRKQYGDKIKLYRAVGLQQEKATTNWATTEENAKQYGKNVISNEIPIDNILAVNVGIKGRYEEFIVVEVIPKSITKEKAPTTEVGQPEAGLQPSMLEEVSAKEVRPKGKSKVTQISMDEQVKLEQARALEPTQEEYEAGELAAGAREELLGEPAADYTYLIKTSGAMKGELSDLTFKQYRDLYGADVDIKPNILTADGKHVAWEYALDGKATELGYENGDAFHDAIVRAWKLKQKFAITSRSLTPKQRKKVTRPLESLPEPTAREATENLKTTGTPKLTTKQVKRTLDLFGKYIESETAIDAWELTRELRRETLSERAGNLQDRAQELMVSEGKNAEDAMNQAIRETMAGELPSLTTDYLSDLTEQMRDALFNNVYQTLKDEPFEMMSTATALTNALLGKPIPREPGAKGGSAYTRLQRVFGDQPLVLKAIEKMATENKPLSDVVEGIFHETGRDVIPVDQATAEYLRNLPTDVQYTPTAFREPIPVTRYEAPIEDAFKELPLWPTPVRDNVVRALKEIGMLPIDIGNFLRANKASFDFSFWRQQAPLIVSHPIAFAKANIEAWKAVWSQKSADSSWNSIIRDPLYQIYEFASAKGGDFLRPAVLSKGMAQYTGTEEFGYTKGTGRLLPLLTSKLPWVKISARAFETGTNEHNWLIFKNYYKAMLKLNEQYATGKKKLKEGESFNIQQEMTDFSKSLANFTARGSLGKFAITAPELSALFFAPRASLGRILSVADLVNKNPRVRKEAWKNASLFVSTVGGIILMGAMAGWWDVDDENPNSAEYMSIRIGNTRIDPWGGYRQFLTFFARAIDGVGISAVTGAEYKTDPLDLIQNLLRGKASPLASTILDFWRGKNFVGEKVDISNKRQWVERVAPFSVWDIYEAYVDDPQTAALITIPAMVGAGVQTYTGDWKENANKLGLPKFDDNLPRYNIEDYWSDTASQFKGVDPETLTVKKGFDPRVKTMVEAKQILDSVSEIPNRKLISINTDPAEGDTFIQYYEQWNDREELVATGDEAIFTSSELQPDKTYKTVEYKGDDAITAYDKKFPQAEQGNMSQTDYVALLEYNALPPEEQKQYLIDNPSINTNLRQDWLRTHPKENALLAMHGKADFLTMEAYTEGVRLLKELDYPKSAWPDNMPPENVAQSHFDYREATDDFSSGSAEAQLILAKDPDYVAWRKSTNEPLTTPEQPVRYYELKVADRDANDAWKLLSDKNSTEYIEDIKERRAKLLETGDYKDYFDNEARVEAISNTFPDEQIEAWVEHEQISAEHGGSSPQIKVWAFENPEAYQKALDEELITDRGALPTAEERGLYEPWAYEAEKLKVQYTDEGDFYKTLSSKSDFPDTYIDDIEERWTAFNEEYPDSDYRIGLAKIEAHNKFFPEADVELWAEKEQIAIDSGFGSAEVKVFYLDNPDLHALAKEAGLVDSDMDDWNEPVLRIDVAWRDKDAEYDAIATDTKNPETGVLHRTEWLQQPENEEYRKDRRRREAYQLNNSLTGYDFPDTETENYVSYNELSIKGKRRDRFLVDNPEFAKALYDAGSITDVPIAQDVPAVQYDDIYDQNKESFDRLDGASNPESIYFIESGEKNPRTGRTPREQEVYDLKFDGNGKLTEFGIANIRRNGYARFVPEAYIERYVDYEVIRTEGKPKDWPVTRYGSHNWYEDDWYLIEHPNFYNNVYATQQEYTPEEKKAKDEQLAKVPSREVFDLYVQYEKLPQGKPREDFRYEHPDLEAWGQKAFGWTSIKEKTRRANLSTAETVEEELRRLEELLK